MTSTDSRAVGAQLECNVGRLKPDRDTAPHAVRWAQREIRGRFDTQYSAWHWTDDANVTACGRRIMLIADGPALLPETRDDESAISCSACRRILQARHETPNV